MFDNSFYPHINQPTRITATSATCIDHIWSNVFDRDVVCGIISETIADHMITFQCSDIEIDKPSSSESLKAFRKIDYDDFSGISWRGAFSWWCFLVLADNYPLKIFWHCRIARQERQRAQEGEYLKTGWTSNTHKTLYIKSEQISGWFWSWLLVTVRLGKGRGRGGKGKKFNRCEEGFTQI